MQQDKLIVKELIEIKKELKTRNEIEMKKLELEAGVISIVDLYDFFEIKFVENETKCETEYVELSEEYLVQQGIIPPPKTD